MGLQKIRTFVLIRFFYRLRKPKCWEVSPPVFRFFFNPKLK